jgi:hypothetical protein
VSRDEVLDEAIANAWGPDYDSDADELRALFCEARGVKVASFVCDLCGNREIGSVRRIPYGGTEHLIAGRTEDVAVADQIMRRILFENDAAGDDPRHGRRRAGLILAEPVRRDGIVSAWCPKHRRFQVSATRILKAMSSAQPGSASTVRVTATDQR